MAFSFYRGPWPRSSENRARQAGRFCRPIPGAARTELWTRQFGTAGDDSVGAIAVDAAGVYVVTRELTGAFVRKYDAAGNELWTRQFGTAGPLAAVAVDASGLYVAGFGTLPG